jgi:hypothetical protein
VDDDQPRNIAIETDAIQELEKRDEDTLVGDEHPKKHELEENVGASELPLRKNITI